MASLSGVSGTAALTVTAAVSASATVKEYVVDSLYQRQMPGLAVTLSSGSTNIAVTTDLNGQFSASVPAGSQTLTIAQGPIVLLTTTVTVGTNGSLAEYPSGIIQVALPADPVGVFSDTPGSTQAPPFGFEPDTPFSGQSVTFFYTDSTSTATSVAVAFTGSGCGNLANSQASGYTLQQTQTVAAAGSCLATITASFPSGPQTYTTTFQVLPTSVTLPAVSIYGGYFVPGDAVPSAASPTATLVIGSLAAPYGAMTNGSLARFSPQITGLPKGASLASFLIGISGQSGYLVAPASQDSNGNYYFDLSLDADYFTTNQNQSFVRTHPDLAGKINTNLLTKRGHIGAAALAQPDSLTITVSTIDSQGNVSAPLSYTISLQQEATTLPQLNLVYSGPSALAMGIILPGNGGKVYGGSGYGVFYDPYSFSCGYNTSPYGYSVTYVGVGDQFLANPVYPPLFSAQDYVPPAGVYTVILDYLSNCNQLNRSAPTGNTDYRVTANGTDQTVTFGGTLTPDQVESEIYQTPITLGTFSLGQVAPGGPSVQGRATYEDLKASLGNLNPSTMPLPIRDALVEVHRVSDDTVLASGSTDDNGEFIISFANSGTPGYYVAIKTQNPSGDTVVNQEVDDLSFQHFVVVEPNPNSILDGYAPNQVYEYKSQNYDETVTPNNAVTLDVAVNQNSGAFNIYDKGVSGFRFITSRLDASAPPRLTWGWMTGQDTVYCPGSSCYNNYAKVLSVRSDDTDTAEFMDSTLLHEFGHYYQFNYGSQSTPGGAHDFHNPETPTLAYAEGFATYFGQTVIGSPVYLNVYKDILQNPNDKVWLDLDLPLAAYSTGGPALGTQVPSLLTPGQPTEQTFNLSEALPAAAMWALTKEEGTVAVFEALGAMKTLTKISATNRDPQGFDFVDFLDSWSCVGLPLGSPFSIGVPGSGLHYILHSGLQFPYDYAAPCPP